MSKDAAVTARPAVRIRCEALSSKKPTEILKAVTPIITGAYAARTLRSGDIEVAVVTQQDKDRALNNLNTQEFQVLRQDYPVELWGVPLDTPIDHGRNADNSRIISGIKEATKRLIPNLHINKIRWLHSPKEHAERIKRGKVRGTLIVSLPTQEAQHQAIRKGLVLEAELFEAHLHDHGAQVKQCFNCSQWGHTQTACSRPAKCGRCAGAHQTRACTGNKESCANCGKAHKSWQKAVCRTFKAFLDECKARKIINAGRARAIRNQTTPAPVPQPAKTFHFNTQEQTTAGQKRPRTDSEGSTTPRGAVGRPSHLSIAGKDPRQTRIASASPAQAASMDVDSDPPPTSSQLLTANMQHMAINPSSSQ